mmetsp:Transcript_38184/g.65478  ORF Transcript_38184/g.65478 Transcript_38184/m.65478 type:complete len:196 (-) Transcript_38184:28-615(-)
MLHQLVIFLLLALSVSASFTQCPRVTAVSDGDKISASWEGYNVREVISFDWSVVGGSFNGIDNLCTSISPIGGLPNVMYWSRVRKSNQVSSQYLSLDRNEEYRVLLRITAQDGTFQFVSAPVEFIEKSVEDIVSTQEQSAETKTRFSPLEVTQNCEIDEQNRCRAAQISTREKLNDLYGAPQWATRQSANFIYSE